MGKALYRKYRSRSLSEIVGQEHITTTLGNALAAGKIAHAYLLTGPRGVGKTSIARILAHEINKLPYSEDPQFDIIEIDAASNNGVEDVRDLRDKIMAAPASAQYKVFIIDEVHMLSRAAFNALLKTLEEPPAHVVFILATTEVHKLPATIISRTQRYSFRPAQKETVVALLRDICQKEDIAIEPAALDLIAEHGEGSFRDSISLLDQASGIGDAISTAHVEQLLGLPPSDFIQQILDALLQHNTKSCLGALNHLRNQGYEPAIIALQLGKAIRGRLADDLSPDLLVVLRELLQVPPAHNAQTLLELILMQYSAAHHPKRNSTETATPNEVRTSPSVTPQTTERPAHRAPSAPVSPQTRTPVAAVQKPALPEPEPTPPKNESKSNQPADAPAASATTPALADLWQETLTRLKSTHNTLYGIARMAKPRLAGSTLTLELTFAFHQKRLSEAKNLAVLTQYVEEIAHQPITVQCLVKKDDPVETQPQADTLSTISNIFGGAELLES